MRSRIAAAAALAATVGLTGAVSASANTHPIVTKQVGCQLNGKGGSLHSTLTIYSQHSATPKSTRWGQWFYMSALPVLYWTDTAGGKNVKYRYNFWRFGVRYEPTNTASGPWKRSYSNPAQIGNSAHPEAGDRYLWSTQWTTYVYKPTTKQWVSTGVHPTCEIHVIGKVPPA